MLDFSSLQRTSERSWFFLPEALRPALVKEMRAQNLNFISKPWDKVPLAKVKEQAKAAAAYQKAGYDVTTCMGAIVSFYDPKELFEITKRLWAPNEASQEHEKKAMETYNTTYQDVTGIPVAK